jgi:ParB-like chromosome segregation protein Spo0J
MSPRKPAKPQAATGVPGVVDLTRFVELPLTALAFAPWNYKRDDPTKLDRLMNNIKLNGQVENLIVRELPTGFYEVLNGNHRLEAFRRLGFTTAVCFNAGKLTDLAAQRLAIETNETRFAADPLRLASLLHEVSDGIGRDAMGKTMPFSDVDLDRFDGMLHTDWTALQAKIAEGPGQGGGPSGDGGQDEDLVTCPRCGFKFNPDGEG